MALDRGTLARVDRRVLVELDHSSGVQAVKVPVSDAVWSTWRRYSEALGLTMGQAIAGLIGHELATVVDEAPDRVFDLQSELEDRAIGARGSGRSARRPRARTSRTTDPTAESRESAEGSGNPAPGELGFALWCCQS